MNNHKMVFDIDDTLNQFANVPNNLVRFPIEKDFFYNIKPSQLTDWLNDKIESQDININDIYIVSASPHTQADKSKMKWLNKYVPKVKKDNILFVRLGQNKASKFMVKYNINDLSSYVLIDDYTKNLLDWMSYNGKVLKCINDTNNTKQSYLKHNIKAISPKDNYSMNI